MRWALAGRCQAKLEAVRFRLAAVRPEVGDLPLVIADIRDKAAVRAMAESARVVITTVGPYINCGEPVVAACASAGVDYVDITGEPEFVDLMSLRYPPRGRGERSAARPLVWVRLDPLRPRRPGDGESAPGRRAESRSRGSVASAAGPRPGPTTPPSTSWRGCARGRRSRASAAPRGDGRPQPAAECAGWHGGHTPLGTGRGLGRAGADDRPPDRLAVRPGARRPGARLLLRALHGHRLARRDGRRSRRRRRAPPWRSSARRGSCYCTCGSRARDRAPISGRARFRVRMVADRFRPAPGHRDQRRGSRGRGLGEDAGRVSALPGLRRAAANARAGDTGGGDGTDADRSYIGRGNPVPNGLGGGVTIPPAEAVDAANVSGSIPAARALMTPRRRAGREAGARARRLRRSTPSTWR